MKRVRHAWRKQGLMTSAVIEKNFTGKRPLGKPRSTLEDYVFEDVETLKPRVLWKETANDMNKWRVIVS